MEKPSDSPVSCSPVDAVEVIQSPAWTLKEVRDSIPPRLFARKTLRGLSYYIRDVVLVATLYGLAGRVDWGIDSLTMKFELGARVAAAMRYILWLTYWVAQSFSFTGLWMMGHECGHRGISSNHLLCDVLGFVAHSALITPYFSWKISHHRHHMYNASLERDENFVPQVQKKSDGQHSDSAIEDAPFYTLARLLVQQIIGLPLYFAFNVGGQPLYPVFTSHYNPYSVIFLRHQRNAIILSDLGVGAALWALHRIALTVGFWGLLKLYGVPWLLMNHWVVMVTFLHHTDPKSLGAWTPARGAAATVDRNFMGFVGRFFFHDISHFHVVHHMFPSMPFYNGEEATVHVRRRIGKDYHYSDKSVWRALWDNFNACWYVDSEGDIVYYRNQRGEMGIAPHSVGQNGDGPYGGNKLSTASAD